MTEHGSHNRPANFEERYRLYLDESGDHVFKKLDEDSHRYLCLLGCWFKNPAYLEFHEKLENFKRKYLPVHPDEPIILHREDIINRRGSFGRLCNQNEAVTFDSSLIQLIDESDFQMIAVVIDKLKLQTSYGNDVLHPYHIAMGFLLRRYCGHLNHINRTGDVMAESRGGKEDRLLKDSYNRIFEGGMFSKIDSNYFQHALTSSQIKIKPKSANIAGLQLADLLGHPVKQKILRDRGVVKTSATSFAEKLLGVIETKWNNLSDEEQNENEGWILYPK